MFDIQKIKKDFPIFERGVGQNGDKRLVYLDSAATAQKPSRVLSAEIDYYRQFNANVGRSSHYLAEKADELYEGTRKKVADFINAQPNEVIFTKNTTEALNIVAYGWGQDSTNKLQKGDVILTTIAEHNSSILPWKRLSDRLECKIEYIETSIENDIPTGMLTADWKKSLTPGVKVVVVSHASNVLGVISPIKEICKVAHEVGAVVVVDGAQAIGHIPVDVKSLGCDFYAFSGHKMFGPMGVGVLWGKEEHLKNMNPLLVGGGMVKGIGENCGAYELEMQDIPHKFEAGTPNVGGVVALGEAINYLTDIGIENIRQHDIELTQYALEKLGEFPEVKVLGPANAEDRVGLVSFIVENIHSHDVAAVLSSEGVAVRAGMQCAMHLYKKLNLPTSTRASFHIYNTKEDIDVLVSGVKKALSILR